MASPTASAVQLQHRRGTAAQVLTFTGAQGEVVYDLTNNRVVVQDGVNAGGWPATKLSENAYFRSVVRGINFGAANTDYQVPIVLPPGFTNYLMQDVYIFQASNSISGASFAVFTGAAATGTTVVSLTSVIIDNASQNFQGVGTNNANTFAFTNTVMFFRVGSAVGGTASVLFNYVPLF